MSAHSEKVWYEMSSRVKTLATKKLISPPQWLVDNVQLEVLMGSIAYGVATSRSDEDIYGFCIPHKDMIFPHLAGDIPGFGRQKKRFDQYQQHGIKDTDAQIEYDITIYSIVKYFSLLMENNPNIVDSLFVPRECVLHTTQIGEMVREKRRIFLHKGCYHKFRGYSFSQLHKMKGKNPEPGSKRAKLREKYGADVKFMYHIVRLLDEVEQILMFGDLDLQRAKEYMKAIRRGEVSEEDIIAHFNTKEKQLEKVYEESKLPWGPDEPAIKQLLIDCLEVHYGDLSHCIVQPDKAVAALRQVQEITEKALRSIPNG